MIWGGQPCILGENLRLGRKGGRKEERKKKNKQTKTTTTEKRMYSSSSSILLRKIHSFFFNYPLPLRGFSGIMKRTAQKQTFQNKTQHGLESQLAGGRPVGYLQLYNELCKARVLIGLEECVIRV